MNNQRRAKLRKAIKQLDAIKDRIAQVSEMVDEVKMDEETMFDNLPDWKQVSDHGLASEDAARDMGEAISELEYADTNLEEAVNLLKGIADE